MEINVKEKKRLYKGIIIIPSKKRFEGTYDVWVDVWGYYDDKKQNRYKREKIGTFDMVDLCIQQPHRNISEKVWLTSNGKTFCVRCPDRRLWVSWKGTAVSIKTYPEDYNQDHPNHKKLIKEYEE
jgi:hypothetical protein